MWGYNHHQQLNSRDLDEVVYNLEQLVAQGDKTFSNEAVIAFLGGFSGAFFAFLFDRLAESQNKKRARYSKHRNALVRLEYTLVKQQDNISRLVFSLENSAEKMQQDPPVMPANRFPELTILEDIELSLGDINLINEVANYWLAIERVNTDTETINRLLESMNTAMLSGITLDRRNFEHVSSNMISLANHLKNNVLDENIALNAYVALLIAKEKERGGFKKALQGYKIIEHEIYDNTLEQKKQEIYDEIERRKQEDANRLNTE